MVRPAHPTASGARGSGVRGPRRPRRGPGSALRSAHQPAISEVFLRDYESGSASAPCFTVVTAVRVGVSAWGPCWRSTSAMPPARRRGGRSTSAECVHRPRARTHGPGGPAVTVDDMRRGDWALDPEMLWAASTEGVITARELESLGVPEGTTYRRCRDGGPWQRIGPGIVALHNGTPTWRQHLIAGLLHAGDHAVITGRAALRLHGLRQRPRARPRAPPDAACPAGAQLEALPHRTDVADAPCDRAGGPRRRAPLPGRPRRGPRSPGRAGDRGVPGRTRAAPIGDRRSSCSKNSTQGAARAARPPEPCCGRSRTACDRSRSSTRGRGGSPSRSYRPRASTCAFWTPPAVRWASSTCSSRSCGFAWEIDSTEHHFATPDQVDATLRRQRALRAVGLHLVSTRPSQRRDDPAGTLRDLLDGLAVAAALPAPRATFEDDIPRAA